MAGRVVLRCAALRVNLRLPWWPDEVTHTPSAWNVASLDRPQRPSYDAPTTVTTEERSMGFTLRNEDYRESVQPLLDQLEALAESQFAPVQLLMGDRDTGLWRLEAPQVTELAWADDGTPSVVDVSLVLKRASSAIVRVGPVRRLKKGKGKGVSKQAKK